MESCPKAAPMAEALQFSAPLLSIEQFKKDCVTNIGQDRLCDRSADQGIDAEREHLANLLDVDVGTIEELEEVCSPEALNCEYDERFDYKAVKVWKQYPDNSPLETVKLIKRGLRKAEETKYAPTFTIPDSTFNQQKSDVDLPVPNDEVIITVSIYHAEYRRRTQEFNVLSTQYLTEFRDKIKCNADNIVSGEFSETPNLAHAKFAKDTYKSSFFFIDGVFYNDMRDPQNKDYSTIIIDWARASERYATPGLGLFTKKKMEETQFKDLNIRLGFPYMFCHQGNCEHVVIFTEMRLVNDLDPTYMSAYPYPVFICKRNRTKCSICSMHLIKWVTVHSPLAFEDPSFFCNRCFDYLHYDTEGRKVMPFEAYPYFEKDF